MSVRSTPLRLMRDHREAYQIIEELLFREFRQGRARRRGGGHCCALLLNNYPRGNVLASIYSQVREGGFRRAARRGDVRFARRRACLCGVYDVKTRVGIFTSARGLTHCLGGVADALKSSTSNAGIETSWTTQTSEGGAPDARARVRRTRGGPRRTGFFVLRVTVWDHAPGSFLYLTQRLRGESAQISGGTFLWKRLVTIADGDAQLPPAGGASLNGAQAQSHERCYRRVEVSRRAPPCVRQGHE